MLGIGGTAPDIDSLAVERLRVTVLPLIRVNLGQIVHRRQRVPDAGDPIRAA